MTASLADLLDEVRDAEPSDRISNREAVAAHGEAALDAMADWLSDRRLCSFAVRVIERVGTEPSFRDVAVATLVRADRSEWPSFLHEDADETLVRLGYRAPTARRQSAESTAERPVGTRGRPGRGYWVMRTSPRERPFLWAEALEGRLRQGWGVADEQDLGVIAEAIRNGRPLTGLQKEARRALRMLNTWPGGMNVGDLVVAPNLPQYGRLSLFEVTGTYYWQPGASMRWNEQFGHVLPVSLLEGDVDRWSGIVTDALRSALRPQARLYNITGYGGDVERLIGGPVGPRTDRQGERWTEDEYQTLFERHPSRGERPSQAEAEEIGLELGRTTEAILWQWEDGANYVQGRAASTTSDVLKTWLDRSV